MKFIGITGGVGAGKSAILEYIAANYNAKVMLADEIAHDLMMPGTKCYDTIKAEVAKEQIFLADGNIDRPRMAQVIFNDDRKRERMNGIVHPAVKDYILEIYRQEQEKGELEYLILEAALLIEEHYDNKSIGHTDNFLKLNISKKLNVNEFYDIEIKQDMFD